MQKTTVSQPNKMSIAERLEYDLKLTAHREAGHIVVAGIQERIALGAYIVPNPISDSDDYSSAWSGRRWGPHGDRAMPEVGVAGLVSAMLFKDPNTSLHTIGNYAGIQVGSGEIFTMLWPWEVELVGGYDVVDPLFDPGGACEKVMGILKEHGAFVDWVVTRLCHAREVTPMQVFEYLLE